MRYTCAACGALERRSVRFCITCGVEGALFPAPEPPRDLTAAVPLAEAHDEPLWRSRSALGEAFGGAFSPAAVVLLVGPAGSGKTHAAVAAVLELGRRALHCDGEMTAGQCRDYYRRAGADDDALRSLLRVGPIGWGDALAEIRRHDPEVVVVDSLQKYATHGRARACFIGALRQLSRLVLVTSQVNARGTAHGGPDAEHDGDAVAYFARTGDDAPKILVSKRRWTV